VSKLSRRSVKFWRLAAADRLEIIVILLMIIFVRLGLTVVGYAKLRRLIPCATALAPVKISNRFGRRIPRLARFVPGATCLTQAFTAQLMLARRGYKSEMRVGVRQDDAGKVLAHAWLLSQGEIVLGGEPADLLRYSPLVDLSPRSS